MKTIIMIAIGMILIIVLIVLLRLYTKYQMKQKRKPINDLDGMFLLNEHPKNKGRVKK